MTKISTLNIGDIVSDVHREFHHHEVSKGALDEIIRGVFDAILTRTAQGEPVNIRNFGTFAAKLFKGRTLHTPLMTEATQFPDMLILRFKQSTTAKAIVNQRAEEYEAKKAGKKAVKKATAVVEESDGEVPVKRGPGRPPKAKVADNVTDISTAKKTKKAAPVAEVEETEEVAVPAPKKVKKAAAEPAPKAEKAPKAKKVAEVVEEAPKKAKKAKAAPAPAPEEDDEIEDLDVDADEEIEDTDDEEIDIDEDEEVLDVDDEDDEDEEPAPAKKAKKAKA